MPFITDHNIFLIAEHRDCSVTEMSCPTQKDSQVFTTCSSLPYCCPTGSRQGSLKHGYLEMSKGDPKIQRGDYSFFFKAVTFYFPPFCMVSKLTVLSQINTQASFLRHTLISFIAVSWKANSDSGEGTRWFSS